MEYLTLGLNIALIVFVVMGVIFGLIRGLRKTASRGIFLILTTIILLFVTPPITSALLQIQITADMTIMEETLTGTHSIYECLEFLVQASFGKDFVSANPGLIDVITALPMVLINSLVYWILFIVCKYLLMPLNYLFYRLTFAPKKKKEKLGFSAFGDDFDFDKVENQILSQNSANAINKQDSSKDSSNETPASQPVAQPNKIDENKVQPLTTQPLHEIYDASEESTDVSTAQSPEDIQTLNTSQTIDTSNATEEQFGKDGLFIKKEIESPAIESVVSQDFDKPSKKDLKRAKKEEKKKNKIKVKKYRWWGALVGAFVGMFVMTNVCMPIYSIMNIARDINKVKISHLSDEEISLDSVTDGMSSEIITAYDSSIFSPFSKYLGLEGISLAEFDLVTSTTINGRKISLRGDVNSLINTVKKADDLVGKYRGYTPNGQMSDLTQAQLTTLLGDSKELLDYAKKVNLVDCVADYIIPLACSMVVQSDTAISDNDVVNNLAINALKALAKANNINVFDETYNILDLATYLNDQGLLIQVLQGKFSDPIATIRSLDSNFGTEFTSKLFKLQTVKLTIPYVLNITLSLIEQSINYGYVENDYSQSIEDVQSGLSNFMQECINVIKSVDTQSNIYLTTESLEPLGKLLQTIKVSGIVGEETYDNLMDYAVTQLQSLLEGLLPDELEDYLLNEFVANIVKVDRWDEEMNKIASGILKLRDKNNGILGEVVDGEDLRKGTTITIAMKEGVFKNLGEALDILDGTVLFGAVSTKSLSDVDYTVSGTISMFVSLLDYASSTISNDTTSSMKKITNVISDMQDNLIKSGHTYNSETQFWAYEMENVSTLVIEVYDMIKSENFDITDELGKGMDKAKYTTILGNDTTLKFMSIALDIVKDGVLGETFEYNNGSDISCPQVLNDKIYELFAEIQDNLQAEATKEKCGLDNKFWQNELVYYRSLKNIAENSNLSSIDDARVLASDLDCVMNSYTIPSAQIFDVVSFAIREIKDDSATTELDIAINNVIDKIADRLDYEDLCSSGKMDSNGFKDFWQIEFDHLANIMDIKFTDDGDYKIKNNLKNIGIELDKVVLGYTVLDDKSTLDIDESRVVRKSYLIESNDLREVLASAIPQVRDSVSGSFDADIRSHVVTALNSIRVNIADTAGITDISFEKELTHMQTLANINIDSSVMKYPTSDQLDDTQKQAEIQAKLDANKLTLNALGKQLDSIAYAYTLDNVNYKYTDKLNASTSTNSKFITRPIINDLIIGIFSTAKVDTSAFPTDENLYSTEQKEQVAFNNLIVSIQNNISSISSHDQIMSWQRELSYVNSLIKMNGGVEYDLSNVATNVGANLDAVAFNVTDSNQFLDIIYDSDYNCTYIPTFTISASTSEASTFSGNSLFVTRENIATLLSAYLNRVKETITADDTAIDIEQKNLVNDVINNVATTVAQNNVQLADDAHYRNYELCLGDMYSIKCGIDDVINDVENDTSTLSVGLVTNIDTMLNNYQSKPAMGILLTRRMANLIVHKIGVPTAVTGVAVLADAISYYNALENHYSTLNTANNNTNSEYYHTSSAVDASYYPNPFVTLYNKMNISI